jgi:hypothetical protein
MAGKDPVSKACKLALVVTVAFAPSFSQVLVPVPYTSTGDMQLIDDKMWFGSSYQLFRLSSDSESPRQVPMVRGFFHQIIRVGNNYWISASGNLYRADLDGSRIVPISGLNAPEDANAFIWPLVSLGDEIWFSLQLDLKENHYRSSYQLYRLPAKATVAIAVGDPIKDAVGLIVTPVGDRLFLGTFPRKPETQPQKKWLSAAGTPTSAPDGILGTTEGADAVGGSTIVSTPAGLYRVGTRARSATKLTGISGQVEYLEPLGDSTLIVTNQGVFRVPLVGTAAKLLCDETCKEAVPFPLGEGAVWLATDSGVFRMMATSDWQPQRVGGDSGRPSGRAMAIEAAGDTVTFVTVKGGAKLGQ